MTGPEAMVEAARRAEDDLRAVGSVVGDLVFTPDPQATEISVAAEIAPEEEQG